MFRRRQVRENVKGFAEKHKAEAATASLINSTPQAKAAVKADAHMAEEHSMAHNKEGKIPSVAVGSPNSRIAVSPLGHFQEILASLMATTQIEVWQGCSSRDVSPIVAIQAPYWEASTITDVLVPNLIFYRKGRPDEKANQQEQISPA